MQISLNELFDIPSSTPQQRKLGSKGTHPTEGLRYARAAWQALLEKHRPTKPMEGPIRLNVTLLYHVKRKTPFFAPKTTRPDGDNLLKIIKDAATRAGWWFDDAQVFREQIARYQTSGEETVTIRAWEAEEDEKLW